MAFIYDDPNVLDQVICDLRLVAQDCDDEEYHRLTDRIDALRSLSCDKADARLREWLDAIDRDGEDLDYGYGRGRELCREFRAA